MSLAGKTVLVTGAGGFIGFRTVEKLITEHNAEVRALVRSWSSAMQLARFDIDIVTVNLSNADEVRAAVRGCDVIMHCAHETLWNPDLKQFTAERATQNICDAVISEGVDRFVHVSSFAVYGNLKDGDLTEASEWLPADHEYTDAKRRTEALVLSEHKKRALPVVVLQPTIVYGPWGKAWTQRPFQELKTGIVPLVDGGHGYCNAVYVDDVVDAMCLAAVRPGVEGEVFLISDQEPVTWREFYGAFEDILGYSATREVSTEEILGRQRELAKQKQVIRQYLRALRSPELVWAFFSIPPFSWIKQGLKHLLPAGQRQKVVGSVVRPANDRQGVTKPLHVPNETQLGVYRPKVTARIDKAQRLLGYTPVYRFKDGMDKTGQYARWAKIA